MRIEFDSEACEGWFKCLSEWDAFEMDVEAGRAALEGSEETDHGCFVREVPADAKDEAIAAAEVCPVDAIRVFDGDERIYP